MEEGGGVKSATDARETAALESQSQSTNQRPPRLNKYALACAVLASTNSILLGYGNYVNIVDRPSLILLLCYFLHSHYFFALDWSAYSYVFRLTIFYFIGSL